MFMTQKQRQERAEEQVLSGQYDRVPTFRAVVVFIAVTVNLAAHFVGMLCGAPGLFQTVTWCGYVGGTLLGIWFYHDDVRAMKERAAARERLVVQGKL